MTQMLRAARFDIKEITFLKAKNKAREVNIAQTQTAIIEMCDVFIELYKNIMYFWVTKSSTYNEAFLKSILQYALMPIPNSRTRPHPAARVIPAFAEMILYTINEMPKESLPYQFFISNIEDLTQILQRDFDFAKSCVQKNQVEFQIPELYSYRRYLRFKIFKTIVKTNVIEGVETIFHYIIDEMISNPLVYKIDLMPELNTHMKFPLISESYDMINFLVSNIETFLPHLKIFMKMLSSDKIIENERKLIQVDDNVLLMEITIQLLEILVVNSNLADETFEKGMRALIASLKKQYTRPFDPKQFGINDTIKESKSLVQTLNPSDLRNRVGQSLKKPQIINPSVTSRTRAVTVISRRSYGARK